MSVTTEPTPARTISPSAPVRRRRGTLGARDRTFGFMLAAPAVALFLVVAVYPLVAGFGTSLYDQSLIWPGRKFVGFGNYADVWPDFLARLGTTLEFSVLATVCPLLIGVAVAVLLNARLRGRNLLRGVLMLPWLLPGVVVSFLWAWIFNDSYGVINHVLTQLHLPQVNVLGQPSTAMAAVVVAKTWNSFPWVMVVVLAVLQTLPREQLEAAALDGASRRQRFRHVSLPHLIGPVALISMLEFIYNFGSFDMIFVMTGGGPGTSTMTLAVTLYQYAFTDFDLGKAAAMGVLWLGVLSLVCGGYFLLNKKLES
ncbi:sugar ABC transporter permease [Streptacidiphilus sp. PB12-B1b]|uniref:carbohydrate ABC transporter permease n=1 Tax=Streptacidiphilus sp. PB12-B1b TaxID=2705012 RepID=UPI0015FC64AC|nr:sugar ABC transporter permease [Streptacidiphilus sp. PB12-B1b]QMU76502.1 sugar ABC transporter permease [Streptacidiphilus sp. PB12-B1b]